MTYLAKSFLASTLLAVSIAGCSGAAEAPQVKSKAKVETTKHGVSHTGYSKPSAAINFEHDFSGRSSVGAMQIVNMKVMDQYPGGSVEISVTPSEGITLFENNAQRSFAMGNSVNDFQLQFQANSEGVHRINVLAKAKLSNGQVINRGYVMPIYVGDQYQPTKGASKNRNMNDNTRQLQKTSSGGIIVMEAEETITTSD